MENRASLMSFIPPNTMQKTRQACFMFTSSPATPRSHRRGTKKKKPHNHLWRDVIRRPYGRVYQRAVTVPRRCGRRSHRLPSSCSSPSPTTHTPAARSCPPLPPGHWGRTHLHPSHQLVFRHIGQQVELSYSIAPPAVNQPVERSIHPSSEQASKQAQRRCCRRGFEGACATVNSTAVTRRDRSRHGVPQGEVVPRRKTQVESLRIGHRGRPLNFPFILQDIGKVPHPHGPYDKTERAARSSMMMSLAPATVLCCVMQTPKANPTCSGCIFVQSPRSVSLTWPSQSRRMLSGLRSRWMYPSSCT